MQCPHQLNYGELLMFSQLPSINSYDIIWLALIAPCISVWILLQNDSNDREHWNLLGPSAVSICSWCQKFQFVAIIGGWCDQRLSQVTLPLASRPTLLWASSAAHDQALLFFYKQLLSCPYEMFFVTIDRSCFLSNVMIILHVYNPCSSTVT